MTDRKTPTDGSLEKYREYLALLARLQLDAQWRGKVDLSGVVQQTLFEAHQDREQLVAQESAARFIWLRRILANNLADEIRRCNADKRGAGREKSLEAALAASSLRMENWLAVKDTSPSGHMQRDEQALRLAKALARLPEAQREALVLQHWQGWSLDRIAAHLGRTRSAVAGLLKRGLRQMRDELHEQTSE